MPSANLCAVSRGQAGGGGGEDNQLLREYIACVACGYRSDKQSTKPAFHREQETQP